MKKLTVVMPFLNEGIEPVNTIISMNNTADPDTFDIIAINDGGTFEHEEKLKEHKNVFYVNNKHRIGVAASRAIGINNCNTDAALVIDGHMRFDKDDWVNKIHDACMTYPKTVFCTRSYVLHDTDSVDKLDPLRPISETSKHYSLGAKVTFNNNIQRYPFAIRWYDYSNCLKEMNGLLPCVLGANYACKTNRFKNIRSFEGLKLYGYDEQYISIKNWLLGGCCKGLDTVKVGHIFRKTAPFISPTKYYVYNVLFAAHTLLEDEPVYLEKCYEVLKTNNEFNNGLELLKTNWDIVQSYHAHFKSMKTRSIKEYSDQFNIGL